MIEQPTTRDVCLEGALDALAVPAFLRCKEGMFCFQNQAMLALTGSDTPVEFRKRLDEDEARVLRGEVLRREIRAYFPGAGRELSLLVTRNRAAHPQWGEVTVGICLELSSTAGTQLLAQLSHDLRTPLNAILGLSEVLLESGLRGDQRDFVRLLKSSAESACALVGDLLDLSKADLGKLSVNLVRFSVRRFCDEALQPLAYRARANLVEFQQEVDPDVPDWLIGDPLRLRQVLQNLAGNAVRYTEQGRVDVGVSMVETVEDKVLVRFQVRDTGMGIPPEQHAIIFEPFTQAHGSATRRHGGTGLGLSIAHRIVNMLGGRIWLESEPGKGSTFYFEVPLRIADSREPVRPWRGTRILVVEEDLVSLAAMRELLERDGYRVTAVETGRAALDRLRSSGFDLVFTDLQLPDFSGIELARVVRADASPALRAIPIVAVTGRTGSDVRDECLREGMHECLSKPVSARDLRSAAARFTGVKEKAMQREPAIDIGAALRVTGGDRKLLRQLAGLFVQECPGLISALRKAVRERDGAAIEFAAHKLKGSAVNLGASALGEAALRVEKQGRNRDLATVDEALSVVDAESVRALAGLQALLTARD